jgi:DNA-binding response OmpR family regulator
MATQGRVLVVDDEPVVCDVLARYLERDGFEVETAADGEDALARFDATDPDLVLLDLMLPRLDGFGVFRAIRARSESPVIMLTARGEVTDRIVGLDVGADDYISKPFSPSEVAARVRAVIRRAKRADRPERSSDREDGQAVIRAGVIDIDPRTREVKAAGRPVRLTPKEFDLLCFLASHPGTVFSRYRLLDEIWDSAFEGDPSTVTVHIRRLREKLERDPSNPRHIVTVWGAGYRFEP